MKNNNQELKVILSKVSWCGHCTNFLPVFNKSQKLTKNNKYLKDTNVNFEVYDMEEDLDKFKSNNYEDLLPQINGYPTVIVTSLKNGKRVNTEIINHSNDPQEFINTVGETYNKLVSQSGGNIEELYKQKYLKYKQKYTELKLQMGGARFSVNVYCAIEPGKQKDYPNGVLDVVIYDRKKEPDIKTFTDPLYLSRSVCCIASNALRPEWPKDSDDAANRKYQADMTLKFIDIAKLALKNKQKLPTKQYDTIIDVYSTD